MVAWQPAPDPPRTAYSIYGHSGSTIAVPAPTPGWNVNQPVISELPVIRPEPEFDWVQPRHHRVLVTFCTSCCKRNWNERSFEWHARLGVRNAEDHYLMAPQLQGMRQCGHGIEVTGCWITKCSQSCHCSLQSIDFKRQ
ncbi:MAG: hypothetical protein WCF30_15050 [Terracidiphilus sp.]